ncbi:MAG: hypothetical protein ABI828_01345 [Actinomycetota bacterium]
MCRAVKVMCVAGDADALSVLKRAAVSAAWELTSGATDERMALDEIDIERPHVLVVFGGFPLLLQRVADRFPGMRVISDRQAQGVTAVAQSLDEVRLLIKGMPKPGGPVT